MVICLQRCANDLHGPGDANAPPIISCFINIQFGLAFLVPAYPGCPGKEAVKRVSLSSGLYCSDFYTDRFA